MWDLAESTDSIALIESFLQFRQAGGFGLPCPGVLHRVTHEGAPIVKGKRVTGFTNGEEEEVHLTHVVPFLVEDELKRVGGIFEKVSNWQPFSVVAGRLVTGQNPASSTVAAQELLKMVGQKAAYVSAAGVYKASEGSVNKSDRIAEALP